MVMGRNTMMGLLKCVEVEGLGSVELQPEIPCVKEPAIMANSTSVAMLESIQEVDDDKQQNGDESAAAVVRLRDVEQQPEEPLVAEPTIAEVVGELRSLRSTNDQILAKSGKLEGVWGNGLKCCLTKLATKNNK